MQPTLKDGYAWKKFRPVKYMSTQPEKMIDTGGTPEARHTLRNYIVISNRVNEGDTFEVAYLRCYVSGSNHNNLVRACCYEKLDDTFQLVAVGEEVLVKNFTGWKDFPISFTWPSGKEYWIGLGGNRASAFSSLYLYYQGNVSGYTNYSKGFTYPDFPSSLDWWAGSRYYDEKSNIMVYGVYPAVAVKRIYGDGLVWIVS